MISCLKYKTLYLLTFLVFISCQEESPLDEIKSEGNEYIKFSAPVISVENDTKSTPKDALSAGDKFGVLGYCLSYVLGSDTEINYNSGAADWSGKKSNCAPLVFYKEPVTVTESGGADYVNLKQWYVDGKDLDGSTNENVKGADNYSYSFFAYYPFDVYFNIVEPAAQTTKGAPVIQYTMPQTGNSETSQLDHKITPDAMIGVLYNRKKADGDLKFSFNHILTALGFEVNNYSNKDLKVYSVELRGNFFKGLKIDLRGSVFSYNVTEERYQGIYTLFSSDEGLLLKAPGEGEVVTSSESPIGGEHVLLISGVSPYFGENVEVYLDYQLGDGEKKTFHQGRPTTFIPSPGTKYTAQLNFVGDAFVLQFVVDNNSNWQDGESDNDDIIFE